LAEAEAAAEAAEAAAEKARARAAELREAAATEKAEQAEEAATEAAEEQESDDDNGDDGDEASGAPGRGRRFRLRAPGRAAFWVASVLAVLAIGALATVSVLMVLNHREVKAQQQLSAEYEAAARQGVVTLMSLDYVHVEDNVKAILDNSTGEFHKDFEDTEADFIKAARDSKAITEASVTATAIQSKTATDATALVAATTKVSNSAGAKQEPRNFRLIVSLVRDGDQIKMSKVEFAP